MHNISYNMHRITSTIFFVLLSVFNPVNSSNKPGTHYGHDDYIAYYAGSENSPLIFTIPHGGNMVSDTLRLRHRGCWNETNSECVYRHVCGGYGEKVRGRCYVSTVSDVYTVKLGRMIREMIGQITGAYPHLIVNRLQRSWMDPDEDMDQGTFGQREAVQAYSEYHNFIKEALSRRPNNTTILINIVGHLNYDEVIELGYLIDSKTLNGDAYTASDTSLQSLFNQSPNATDITDLIKGQFSFGSILDHQGYGTVPSDQNPTPHGTRYHAEGFTSIHYASKEVSTIEISVPYSLRNHEDGEKFAQDFSKSLVQFLAIHLNNCGEACVIKNNARVIETYSKLSAFIFAVLLKALIL